MTVGDSLMVTCMFVCDDGKLFHNMLDKHATGARVAIYLVVARA